MQVQGTARAMAIGLTIEEATCARAQLDSLLLTIEAANEANPGIPNYGQHGG